MSQVESWAGLRALWHGLKRFLAVAALGLVGALIGGLTLGLLTFYVYGIGLYLGLPLGFVFGAIAGSRLAPRDVAITFVTAAGTVTGIGIFGTRAGQDSFLTTIQAMAVAAIVALILLFVLPRYVPPQVRYALAVPMSILFWLVAFGAWVWRIYTV